MVIKKPSDRLHNELTNFTENILNELWEACAEAEEEYPIVEGERFEDWAKEILMIAQAMIGMDAINKQNLYESSCPHGDRIKNICPVMN